jgi:hypothetical protein
MYRPHPSSNNATFSTLDPVKLSRQLLNMCRIKWEGTTPNFVRLDRNTTFCDDGGRQSTNGGVWHPTRLHSGFGQLLDVFLALQVLELVAELIIGTVVNEKH